MASIAVIERVVDRIVAKHMLAHEQRLRAVLRRQVIEEIEDAALLKAMLKVDITKTVSRAEIKEILGKKIK